MHLYKPLLSQTMTRYGNFTPLKSNDVKIIIHVSDIINKT